MSRRTVPPPTAPAPAVSPATLFGTLGGLALGFLAGYLVARRPEPPIVAAAPAASAPDPASHGHVGDQLARAERIRSLEQEVARNPKDVQAWIQLGNDYFDTHQAQKSVDAYGKALALQPDNPDVITDQGVMYRELRQFQKALDNFQKANRLNPKHLQSLFNQGVVYAEDLNQPDKAIEAWNRVIAVDPNTPLAQQARQAIQAVQAARP